MATPSDLSRLQSNPVSSHACRGPGPDCPYPHSSASFDPPALTPLRNFVDKIDPTSRRTLETAVTAGLAPLHPPMSLVAPTIKEQPPEKHRMIDVLNPYSGVKISEFRCATKAEVSAAIGAAVNAAPAWGARENTPQRSALLLAFAAAIEANAERIARGEALYSGMPIAQARCGDVDECVKTIRYFAHAIIDPPVVHGTDGTTEWVSLREPIGAIGVIGVWNYAALMFSWHVAGALAYGNTVVFVPSSHATMLAQVMHELALSVGIPAEVFHVLPGGREVGQAMIADDGFDRARLAHICFTGSEAAGRSVVATASKKMITVNAEMGGKSPQIVLEDALDIPGGLDKLCRTIMSGVFAYSGQSCSAGTRLYVHDAIYDRVVPRLVAITQSEMVMGNPLHETTTLGPLISAQQQQRVLGMLRECELGIAQHAYPGRILCGGSKAEVPKSGYFVAPTIIAFDGVVGGDAGLYPAPIERMEVFGPVLTVRRIYTDAEAIQMANDTHDGLAAAVYSADEQRGIDIASQIKAGVVWLNSYGATPPGQPFVGWNASSFGNGNSAPVGEHTAANLFTRTKTFSHTVNA